MGKLATKGDLLFACLVLVVFVVVATITWAITPIGKLQKEVESNGDMILFLEKHVVALSVEMDSLNTITERNRVE